MDIGAAKLVASFRILMGWGESVASFEMDAAKVTMVISFRDCATTSLDAFNNRVANLRA